MKNIKYLLFLFFGLTLFSSCIDDGEDFALNAEGPNVVTFDRIVDHLTGVAEKGGAEYTFLKKVKIVGPTVTELTGDITVTFAVAPGSTATGTMYRINNPTITLKAKDNYLGLLSMTLTTLGNEPPAEGTPAYDAYTAPILKLKVVATGDPNVLGSGKGGIFTLNFSPPNPWAGDYDAHIIYRRPGDGLTGIYPDNIQVDKVFSKKLVGITARKAELSSYAVFEYGADVLSWVTVNPDNSVTYQVDDEAFGLPTVMGDPYRPDLISRYDPVTRKIYLYYHYVGGSGPRIFWEVLTPKF